MSLRATYVDSVVQGTRPGTYRLRTTVLLCDERTDDPVGVLPTVETDHPYPAWPEEPRR